MKRFSGLMRDTWWLWIVLCGGGIIAGWRISFVFFAAIPICIFTFFYFGILRYDENGQPKEM